MFSLILVLSTNFTTEISPKTIDVISLLPNNFVNDYIMFHSFPLLFNFSFSLFTLFVFWMNNMVLTRNKELLAFR